MATENPPRLLHALRRSFGKAHAARKLDLLQEIEALPRIPAADLLRLHDTLEFMRAYPDNARIRRAVQRVIARLRDWLGHVHGGAESASLGNTGYPGSTNDYSYSYAVLHRLAALHPDDVEIDWDALEDDGILQNMLDVLLTPAENEGMEAVSAHWPDWIRACRAASTGSDLQFLLRLFETSGLDELKQANLYESCGLTVRYALRAFGTGRCEVELPVERIRYQRADIGRERFPLEPRIREPFRRSRPLSKRRGQEVIDRSLSALCSRNLEIYPLIYADPRDVLILDGGLGIQVALVGVPSACRGPVAAIYFFLVTKNGVPIAYGPASPYLGCCELGINLFPEFRGGEIRHVYAQVMRLLHHHLAVDYFYLTSYGMGVGNEEAIQSGAFWFYRKLGFRAANPDVEALALEEEERMRRQPGARSSIRTLRRLSKTEAYLDLSDGACPRFDFGRLAVAVSRFVDAEFGGDRRLAVRQSVLRIRRALGLRGLGSWSADERGALERLAPVVAQIPDLGTWRRADKAALTRVIRAKGARSEAAAARLMRRHERLRAALYEIVAAD